MDDNFDAKEWVNQAFQTHRDPGTPKDVSNLDDLIGFICGYEQTVLNTGYWVRMFISSSGLTNPESINLPYNKNRVI